jgi:hypothetical protein
MYEHRSAPLLPREAFKRRLIRHGGFVAALLAFSLVIGTLGFVFLAGQQPIDALLNSAMLLGGMGPVGTIEHTSGKLFATGFALYAGLVFLTAGAILLTPVAHRLIHKFHLADADRSRKSS